METPSAFNMQLQCVRCRCTVKFHPASLYFCAITAKLCAISTRPFFFVFFNTFVSEPLIRLLLPAHAAASPLPIFPLCVSLSVVPRPAAHPYWKGTMLEKTHIFAQERFPNTFKYNFGMTHEGRKKL